MRTDKGGARCAGVAADGQRTTDEVAASADTIDGQEDEIGDNADGSDGRAGEGSRGRAGETSQTLNLLVMDLCSLGTYP